MEIAANTPTEGRCLAVPSVDQGSENSVSGIRPHYRESRQHTYRYYGRCSSVQPFQAQCAFRDSRGV